MMNNTEKVFRPIIYYSVDFNGKHYKWRLHTKKEFYMITPSEVFNVLEFCVQRELIGMDPEKLKKETSKKSFLDRFNIGVTKHFSSNNGTITTDVTDKFTGEGSHLETFVADYATRFEERKRLDMMA